MNALGAIVLSALGSFITAGQVDVCPDALRDPAPGDLRSWVASISEDVYANEAGQVACYSEPDEGEVPELLFALEHFAEFERRRLQAMIDNGEADQAFVAMVTRRFPRPIDQVCTLIAEATDRDVIWPEGVYCADLEGEETARIDYRFSDEQWAALHEATRPPECLQGLELPLRRRGSETQGHSRC